MGSGLAIIHSSPLSSSPLCLSSHSGHEDDRRSLSRWGGNRDALKKNLSYYSSDSLYPFLRASFSPLLTALATYFYAPVKTRPRSGGVCGCGYSAAPARPSITRPDPRLRRGCPVENPSGREKGAPYNKGFVRDGRYNPCGRHRRSGFVQ